MALGIHLLAREGSAQDLDRLVTVFTDAQVDFSGIVPPGERVLIRTRASLLTGLYPHQAGMGHMTGPDRGEPGYRGDLNNQCVTIAEVLKEAGYRTYMAGKWHVTAAEGRLPFAVGQALLVDGGLTVP